MKNKTIKPKKMYRKSTAFVLPNLLPKRKISLLTRIRFGLKMWYEKWKHIIAAAFIGGLIGALIACYLIGNPCKTSPEAIKQTIEVKAIEVTPTPQITWNEAIREVFPADEAGKMIRICMTENKSQSPYSLNENTNGTYDYSWCQVNSCHKPKNMTDDEWKENLRDPMFNALQVRKIYLSQGWNAWVVYNKGLTK
jgi:hypothetical protein